MPLVEDRCRCSCRLRRRAWLPLDGGIGAAGSIEWGSSAAMPSSSSSLIPSSESRMITSCRCELSAMGGDTRVFTLTPFTTAAVSQFRLLPATYAVDNATGFC